MSPSRVAELVGTGQYGLLLWHSDGTAAPTELHLPASLATGRTSVVSDLRAVHGLPPYDASTPVARAAEAGGMDSSRLLLTAPGQDAGQLHFALVTNGASAPSGALLQATRTELAGL